ncbi:unnamed protein product [Boreogadus saida]
MDVSRRNPTKKGNKENAEPAHEPKPSKTRTDPVAPRPFKRIETQPNQGGDSTQGDMQLIKTVINTVQKNAKAMPAGNANKRQTLSKAFLTEQAVKQKKIIESAKPPQPHTKPAPGLYKGKVIQSKIGSIWKTSVVANEGDKKPTARPSTAKVESRRVDNLSKRLTMSVADLPCRADHKPKSTRSKSVSDGPLPVPKRPVTGRPPTALRTAPPPHRSTRPAPPISANTSVMTKETETRNVRDKKVYQPSVSSSLSQYRVPMESAAERRAKLADWLASKGKVPKRPVRSATLTAKTLPAKTSRVEPEPSQVPTATAVVPVPSASQPGEAARGEDPARDASSPLTMNATLDLLDNSDLDLPVYPEAGVNDIVVNLCEALSALATDEDELQQKDQSDDCEMADGMANQDEKELSENVAGCKEVKEDEEVEVKEEEETESDSEEEDDCKEYEIDEEESEMKKTEATPMMEDASSVKYNVKTTPYLQSVKKGLQGEVRSACAGSRKRPGIKDLKFLTPVRRSSRIHRNSCRLPPLVLDHDPCVTSLAELVQLDGDDDSNAYIYRKNPALLKDSPDPKKELLNDSEYF